MSTPARSTNAFGSSRRSFLKQTSGAVAGASLAAAISTRAYAEEQKLVEDLIGREIELGRSHLQEYLDAWSRLREVASDR